MMLDQIDVQQYLTLPVEEALQIVEGLRQAKMLKSDFIQPGEWSFLSEIPSHEMVALLRANLSREGFHYILEAVRYHNRQNPEALWDISEPADFLAAVRLALMRQETLEQSQNQQVGVKELLKGVPGEKISQLARELQRQVQIVYHILAKSAGSDGWLFSPYAFWARLQARARKVRAEVQIEHTLSQAAQYTARMLGSEVEREVVLSRVGKLREQLRRQLEVFCGEQGLPIPEPYSREEAYCLHLLSAYFVSLAEAEEAVAKQASALARRQITLEGKRAEAALNNKVLPELMDTLLQVDPLIEIFLRERVRHKGALMASSVIAALGGVFWGVVEGVNDVFISGIARYAPVVAPPLVLGLVTLVAQTIANGVPTQWEMLANYLVHALWNSTLALGATLIVYGCWQYFHKRRIEPGEPSQPARLKQPGDGNNAEAADNPAK
jgi:hypothetical protein